MAVFNWTTLTNNQVIAFNPFVDVLNVNDATFAAADIGLATTPTSVSITLGAKTVTLLTERRTLTTSNVAFSDGSMLLMGDNTTDTTTDDADNTLTRGPGDDRLYGLGGKSESGVHRFGM